MKWKLTLHQAADRSTLVCEDIGAFQLDRPLQTPKRFYLMDEILLNGVRVKLGCYLEDILRYGAIKICSHGILSNQLDDRLITDPITVTSAEEESGDNSNARQRGPFPSKISWADLKRRLPIVQVWISDPRLLFLAFFSTLYYYKPNLWKRFCVPMPTHKAARAALRQYDLFTDFSISNPPSKHEIIPLLHKIWLDILCEHYPEWKELTAAIQSATPKVPSAGIKLAGVFAIPNREYLLGAIETKLSEAFHAQPPITLVREPHNPHDSNAIYASIRLDGGSHKIGYLPKEWAAEWAPVMDQDYYLNGVISAVKPSSNKIVVNLSCCKGAVEMEHLTIKWGRLPNHWCEATLSITDRTLVYSKLDAFKFTLHFSDRAWEHFVLPTLKRCAFNEWKPVYRAPKIETLHNEDVWHVEVTQGKTRFCSCGCNAYPVEWSLWCEFIDKCLDLNHIKGSGTFTFSEAEAPEHCFYV